MITNRNTSSTRITSNVVNRNARQTSSVMASLNPQQKAFAHQLERNMRKVGSPILGATNTSNIMVRPDFLELLPLFVQKLHVLDVFGSVAMKSRQQLIPYFKFVAENTKGETAKGTILSSPFMNRQGVDPNFTGRIVKNEIVAEGSNLATTMSLVYTPVLPGSVTLSLVTAAATSMISDNGSGELVNDSGANQGYINYSNGQVTLTSTTDITEIKATYQYDNETVGPNAEGQYGAKMGKGYLMLDEINMVAEAHELACYWSLYAAFAAQQEYSANINDIAKEAAFSELTAEINSTAFNALLHAATPKPQFNWNAAPVANSSVMPTDYINTFKLKLNQAAASVYQATRLARPNRIIAGTNVAEYIGMLNSFEAERLEDEVGPYKKGRLDHFEVYVAPDYDPNTWVMCCKSQDIRRNSALFGEYMPLTPTTPVGLADLSVQQGYATMYGLNVVNPMTVVSGKILGTF